MWRIVASILAVILIGGGVAAWVFQDAIRFMVMMTAVKPAASFDEMPAPPAPDYANRDHWAALPDLVDGADFTAAGEADSQAGAAADVFFIYPTTYINKAGWNAPLDDPQANKFVEEQVLRAQASAYNACCKIYAPRYRQATFYSFMDREGSGAKAIALAYSDIEAAFDHYIAHHSEGRPFILAGHSQGARHLRELLERRINGTPLRERMIAAYPIGYYMNIDEGKTEMPEIPVCGREEETGCYASWNAVGPRFTPFRDPKGSVCVNPLTWTADEALGRHEMNKGTLIMSEGGALRPALADAQCLDGVLLVTDIRTDAFKKLPLNLGRDNFHVLDYSLFYKNLRDNAVKRTDAYLSENAAAAQP